MEINKVLLVSNTVLHYRISVYNYFWKRFRDIGWEFAVITNRVEARNAVTPRFRLQEIPFQFSRYRQEIFDFKPDVVIQFLHLKDRIFWPLTHWLKLAGIPVCFWTKTRNLEAPDNWFRNFLFNYMLRLHDALILYSADLMQNVPRQARRKVFVANNTINFEDFPAVRENKADIKRQFGIPFDKIVLFVGRMDVTGNQKRVEHLIEIFRETQRRDVGLVIVGGGMRGEWRARINPQNTVYLGEIHDPQNHQISRIFKVADICAIPGHVGLVLNQAFFFGLPVVTESGRHPPEIGYLKPGRNGFIVPENNLVELREKIFLLLDNDSLRQEFSTHARETILKDGSIEGMYQAFQECVQFLRPQKFEQLPSRR